MKRLAFAVPVFALALACVSAAGAASAKQTLIGALTVAESARQADVSWQSSQPTSAQLTVTDPAGHSLLVSDNTIGRLHKIGLDALQPGTTYSFTAVSSVVDGKKVGSESGWFNTSALLFQANRVSTSSGIFRIDGGGFFPVISWAQCAADVAQGIAAGINTFAGTSCKMSELAAAVQGKAYLMNSLEDGHRYPGQIGWFQYDEADGKGMDPSALPAPPEDLPTLQTLTTHFDAAKMGDIKGVGHHTDYSGYFSHADAIGFDLYPASELCNNPGVSTATVFDLQQAMVQAAAGKPTYQWIETNDIEGKCPNVLSGAMARAEAWLAVAGGADAIGWFTHGWPGGVWQHFDVSAGVQQAIKQTDGELQAYAPVLLARQLPAAQRPQQQVKFGLRELDGTIYVIAVNASSASSSGAVGLPPLKPGVQFKAVLGSGDAQVNARHALTLKLSGYEVRVLAALTPAAAGV